MVLQDMESTCVQSNPILNTPPGENPRYESGKSSDFEWHRLIWTGRGQAERIICVHYFHSLCFKDNQYFVDFVPANPQTKKIFIRFGRR